MMIDGRYEREHLTVKYTELRKRMGSMRGRCGTFSHDLSSERRTTHYLEPAEPQVLFQARLDALAQKIEALATPNIQYDMQPLSLKDWGAPLDPYPAFTVSVYDLRPGESRHIAHHLGRDSCGSRDPAALSVRRGRTAGCAGINPSDPPHRVPGAAPALQRDGDASRAKGAERC